MTGTKELEMLKALRIACLAAPILFVFGCSTYTVVYEPRDSGEPAVEDGNQYGVVSGERVRVTLHDTRVIEGTVVGVPTDTIATATEIQSGFLGRKQTKVETVLPGQVAFIETREGAGTQTRLLAVGIFVGVLAAFGVFVAATWN